MPFLLNGVAYTLICCVRDAHNFAVRTVNITKKKKFWTWINELEHQLRRRVEVKWGCGKFQKDCPINLFWEKYGEECGEPFTHNREKDGWTNTWDDDKNVREGFKDIYIDNIICSGLATTFLDILFVQLRFCIFWFTTHRRMWTDANLILAINLTKRSVEMTLS